MATSISRTRTEKPRKGLKTQPLRLPGQSNEEHISKLQDTWIDVLMWPSVFVVLALVEWWHWWFSVPPNPWVPSFLAALSVFYAYWRYVPLRSEIQDYKLGRDGERLVGEMLEQLRAKGYRVFHDIPGNGFNIDHVIVGAVGVYTIETKTRSKRYRGRPCIVYDGNTLRVEDGQPFDEPLNQARAQARWLASLLNDGRRETFTVRPVVVFPECYVEQLRPCGKRDVWVLNPKALAHFLDHEQLLLSPSLIDSVAHTLSRYCRQPVG